MTEMLVKIEKLVKLIMYKICGYITVSLQFIKIAAAF